MIHEDQNQICSNNNSGGDDGGVIGGSITRSSSSKKLMKQKKVPQRGLGVAQLEKIRMEEQQKNDGNNFSSSSTISPTTCSSLQQTIPLPNYNTLNTNNNTNHKPLKTSLPYTPPSPPPMPMNLSPPSPIFRTRSLPNTENFHLNSVPSLNPSNGDGFQVGWPTIPVHGNVGLQKIWPLKPFELSPDHKLENLVFPPSMSSMPYDTCNVAPLPDVLPSSTLQHHLPSSHSLVNVSSMNLSSSSVLNFPMEPPSNQSFYGNYSPLWPDEEKRSCPFPIDSPPIPTFHRKFAPIATHPLIRSDESTSGGNGGTAFNLDPGITIFRDIPSYQSSMPEPASSRKINRPENGNAHSGEFLSLAPPAITSPFPNSRFKQFCKFETLPYQVGIEDPLMDSRQGSSSQQPNLFSFFPPTKLQATTSASPQANHNSCNSEVGESIDLNLRL